MSDHLRPLVILPETTLLQLTTDIPASCYRCGPVALSREALLLRYGADYRIEQIYNNGHHNHHCPRCAGPIRLLIEWFDADDRPCEIPEDED